MITFEFNGKAITVDQAVFQAWGGSKITANKQAREPGVRMDFQLEGHDQSLYMPGMHPDIINHYVAEHKDGDVLLDSGVVGRLTKWSQLGSPSQTL